MKARALPTVPILITLGLFSCFSLHADTLEDVKALWYQSGISLERGEKQEALIAAEAALLKVKTNEMKASVQVDARLRVARPLVQLGKPILAEDHLIAAADIAGADGALMMQVENELGAVAALRGEYSNAKMRYERALFLGNSAGAEKSTLAVIRVNLAGAELDSGLVEGFAGHISELKKIIVDMADTEIDATLLLSVARLMRRGEREFNQPDSMRESAFNLLSRAERIFRREENIRGRSYAIGYQGQLYDDEGRTEEALKLMELALLFAQQANSLEVVFRWHSQIGKILLAAGREDEARQAFQASINVLAEIRHDLPVGSPRFFAEQVVPVYTGFADVLLQEAARAEDENRQAELLRLVVDNLENLKLAEVEDYFAGQCVIESVSDRSTLLAETAIIYPVFLDNRTEIILETSQGLKQFIIPVPRSEMTRTIRKFRLEIEDYRNRKNNYITTGQLLEEWLINPVEPVLEELGVTTLVVIPDGPLRTIPMAALFDGSQFLIERYALASTPAINLTRSVGGMASSNALVGGVTEAVQGFAPLEYVKPELDNVSEILESPTLSDASFLLRNIEENFSSSEFSVVHFATHGQFSSDFRKSFILTYDDRLTIGHLEEVLRQQGALDLLVLSACQTAAGDDRAALGLAGVAIQAGAESALASLWSISDEGTATLIPEFYNQLYINGLTKAESLQRAQIKLLKNPRFDHPVFWAPYLLIGGWI